MKNKKPKLSEILDAPDSLNWSVRYVVDELSNITKYVKRTSENHEHCNIWKTLLPELKRRIELMDDSLDFYESTKSERENVISHIQRIQGDV